MIRPILRLASSLTACGIAMVLAGSFKVSSMTGQSQTAEELLKRVREYVLDYERTLTFLIADEDYVQDIRDQVPHDPSPQGRALKSEIYFIFAPQTGTWMAVRDVVSVDGHTVSDRPNLMTMLSKMPVTQVDAIVKARNSRFNIGRIIRTFNEPTLALEILDASRESSVEFKLAGTRTDHGTALATLAFRELGPATLIHNLQGQAAPSKGEILLETGTGRVRQTEITTQIGRVSMSLTTDYALEEPLAMWVPSVLREHYEEGIYGSGWDSRVPGTGHEEIYCEGRYSHFHRFEVTGGIKKGEN